MTAATCAKFDGKVVMVGCGAIGQALLAVIDKHIENIAGRLYVLTNDADAREIAEQHGAHFFVKRLTPENFRDTLAPYLGSGDLLINVSINVASMDLIAFCAERDALYVDSSVEPWEGLFGNTATTLYQRSNFVMRQELLQMIAAQPHHAPTAVVDHGANPGIVTHFVKQALLNLDRDIRRGEARPTTPAEWAQLACDLGITTIQISERDSQVSKIRRQTNEFVNTWSISGIIDELKQPSEVALGTFDPIAMPDMKEHMPGCSSYYLERISATAYARSWIPSCGPFLGMLVTHDEVMAIADFLSIKKGDTFTYRPTVMFVYQPCDDALLSTYELEGRGWQRQTNFRLLDNDIEGGRDELGVLLAGHQRNAYWFGSRLSIGEARELVPTANATIMQVVAGITSGLVWALRHRRRGIVEPEALDHELCLAVAANYLGPLVGEYTEWTPLQGRDAQFPEQTNTAHPWDFQNIRSR